MSFSPELAELPPEALRNISDGHPPPGVTPDFNSTHTIAPILIATSTVLFCLASLFMFGRAYTKLVITKRIGWDDVMISIGFLGTSALYGANIWATTKGVIGKHQWDSSLADSTSDNTMVPTYMQVTVSNLTLFFVKITFFFMYLQMFRPLRWMRICIYVGSALLCAFYGAVTITMFVYCTRRSGETFFTPRYLSGLGTSNRVIVPISSVGLAFDLYILVLPVIAVMQIQLPTRRKIGISLIFMSGILACLGSALSIYYRVRLNTEPDRNYVTMPAFLMVVVELTIGIMCACMPSFAKLMRRLTPQFESIRSSLQTRWGSLTSRILSRSHRDVTEKSEATHQDWPLHAKSHHYLTVGDLKDNESTFLHSHEITHPQSVHV